jgi:hypothetical protein
VAEASLGGQSGSRGGLGAGGFGFVVGFVAITSDVVDDALTLIRVKSFAPFGDRTYRLRSPPRRARWQITRFSSWVARSRAGRCIVGASTRPMTRSVGC